MSSSQQSEGRDDVHTTLERFIQTLNIAKGACGHRTSDLYGVRKSGLGRINYSIYRKLFNAAIAGTCSRNHICIELLALAEKRHLHKKLQVRNGVIENQRNQLIKG